MTIISSMGIKRSVAILLTGLIAVGLAMAFMFPAGSSEGSRERWAMQMQGRSAYWLLTEDVDYGEYNPDVQKELRRHVNSTDFILHMSERDGLHNRAWRSLADEHGCKWIIAEQIPENAGDAFPIMLSANINPRLLASGASLLESNMPLGVSCGADRPILDDKAAVVVRLNGDVLVLTSKYCTFGNVLGASSTNTLSVVYLTPSGKVSVTMPGANAPKTTVGERTHDAFEAWRGSCDTLMPLKMVFATSNTVMLSLGEAAMSPPRDGGH